MMYQVIGTITASFVRMVQADSEEEANRKVAEEFQGGDEDVWEHSTDLDVAISQTEAV